jgi:hypothetical protein
MDHIQRKNKLKSCFENLKGHAWKLKRREKINEKKNHRCQIRDALTTRSPGQ